MRKILGCFVLVMFPLLASTVRGGVILDYSPAASGTDWIGAYNQDSGQHFFEPVTFAAGATVTGIALYTPTAVPNNFGVFIDVYDNNTALNLPNNEILALFTNISAVDSDGVPNGVSAERIYADLATPLVMAPGQTLWFSMSGNGGTIGAYLLQTNHQGPLNSYVSNFTPGEYNGLRPQDVSMRLYGSTVPEPGSLALLATTSLLTLRRRPRA
jgi:hypothetical protein